jgi:predicted thioesterase
MELHEIIYPGVVKEESFRVEIEHIAIHVGSGSVRVLATPWMIAFMERTAHRLLTCCLPDGWSSVGTLVNIQHLAATPVGAMIRVRAEVKDVDGRKVKFLVEAWDAVEKIGTGEHERFVIDEERFLRRLETKRASLP